MADMPPLPQQAYRTEGVTRSELMPFSSKKISLIRSRALIPMIALALTCVVLFGIRGSISSADDIMTYMKVLGSFLIFAMFAAIYFYVGERKNMLWYLVPAAITAFQLLAFFLKGWLPNVWVLVFRQWLPGDIQATGFVSAFIGMFFGAGLLEELLKAVPILMALALAYHLRSRNDPGNLVTRNLALQGPVDGLLMGMAAGAAFIYLETLGQYVPNDIAKITAATKGNEAMGVLFGFLLMLPRVLNGLVGHMAYAGIFGYFIGLAVTHRRSMWTLLAIGWLLPSVLHGFWNSSYHLLGEYGTYVSAALTLFFFAACVLKAKQLEVSRLGGPVDGHSVLAVSPPPGTVAAGPNGVVPPAAPGLAGLFSVVATFAEKLAGVTARTTVPNPGTAAPAAPAAASPMPASGLSIGTASARYALAPGQAIDFSSLFGASGVPAGFAGVIGGAPGALDIRNTGSAAWTYTTPDGATASVQPGSSIRPAAGARLLLGSAAIDIQSY